MWFKDQRPERNTGPSPSTLRLWSLTVFKKMYSSLFLHTLHHFNLTVALRFDSLFFFFFSFHILDVLGCVALNLERQPHPGLTTS